MINQQDKTAWIKIKAYLDVAHPETGNINLVTPFHANLRFAHESRRAHDDG